MQDEYGLTLKEGEADMYKHSTNRDVRYAERELHFVIPFTVQGITHLAIFFSSSMQKDANRPLIPSSDTGAASYFTCYYSLPGIILPFYFPLSKMRRWSCLNIIE